MLNYRYSTAVIFSQLGIDIGTTAVPKYQDGSFRFHFPQKNGGALALWGLGGNSSIDIVISDQIAPERNIYGDNDRDQYFRTGMGIAGATYTLPINKKTYIKATLAASRDRQFSNHNLVYRELEVPPAVADSAYRLDSITPFMAYDFNKDRLALALHANRKLNPIAGGPATLRFGLNADLTRWTFLDSIRTLPTDPSDPLGDWGRRWDAAMNSLMVQPFAQLKLRPSEPWTVNVGWHAQFDQRSGAASWFEPRVGLQYVTEGGAVWSAGSGLHSQSQSPYLYASSIGADPDNPGQLLMPNQNMGFTRSWHNVIGWARSLSPNWSLKMEAYYQYLFDIPIADTTTAWGQANGSYSLANAGSSFDRLFPGTLTNAGTSRNYGVEATVSRAFRDGWFVLVNGSVFDAQFQGADEAVAQYQLQRPLRAQRARQPRVAPQRTRPLAGHRRQVHHGRRPVVRPGRCGRLQPAPRDHLRRRRPEHPPIQGLLPPGPQDQPDLEPAHRHPRTRHRLREHPRHAERPETHLRPRRKRQPRRQHPRGIPTRLPPHLLLPRRPLTPTKRPTKKARFWRPFFLVFSVTPPSVSGLQSVKVSTLLRFAQSASLKTQTERKEKSVPASSQKTVEMVNALFATG